MLDVYVVWSSGCVGFAVFYGFGYLVFSDVKIGVWWEFLDGSVCLWVSSVWCFVTWVNCLLKAVAMCLGVVWVLPWKVIVQFEEGCELVPDRLPIVFQRMWVLILWSQFLSRVSCHNLDL